MALTYQEHDRIFDVCRIPQYRTLHRGQNCQFEGRLLEWDL